MREVIPEVESQLGLSYLGLTEKEMRDVLEPIVEGVVESRKTKPSIESIVKRIVSGKPALYKAVAARLLERERLSPEQVEFIVSNAPELAGRAAPRLYHEVKGGNRDYLVDTLRYLWQRYGSPTRIQCPYCGFYSVTPDLTCIVCGRSVEEKDLKEAIRFKEQLAELASRLDSQLVAEILRAGFVLYDGEVHPPSLQQRAPQAVVLYLTREEADILRSRAGEKR